MRSGKVLNEPYGQSRYEICTCEKTKICVDEKQECVNENSKSV